MCRGVVRIWLLIVHPRSTQPGHPCVGCAVVVSCHFNTGWWQEGQLATKTLHQLPRHGTTYFPSTPLLPGHLIVQHVLWCCQDLADIHEILKNIFLIFPNYCLGRGLMDVAFNEYYNEFCFKMGITRRLFTLVTRRRCSPEFQLNVFLL